MGLRASCVPLFVKTTTANRLLEAAALNLFGEYARYTTQRANVVATDDVRMQAQIDPGLALAREIVLLRFSLEVIRALALHSDFGVPSSVMDPVDKHQCAADFPFDR